MKTTLVTGLWDINRSELSDWWGRPFEQHYISKFKELLKLPQNLIIFGESSLRKVVFEHRTDKNTLFIERSKDWFKNEFYDNIQKIRTSKKWHDQAGWIKDSAQARLEMYNPLVMSKMFLLNDARILDKFDSDNLFWIDAGLSHTVHMGYFKEDNVLENLPDLYNKFIFLAFPYKAENEIHGFSYPKINEYANNDVKLVCRAGFFGGHKDKIEQVSSMYYSLLKNTLNAGLMGTEESIFSILLYRYPEYFHYYLIKSNGLLLTFFEDLKKKKAEIKTILPKVSKKDTQSLNFKKIGLYVIGFNSPDQFDTLCKSMISYDKKFIDSTVKYLLNNSTDKSTFKKYSELCKKYGFNEIKKDNIGICGGRQFIAEHFDKQDLDYYFFFEDDMNFYEGKENTCKLGFNRYVNNLFENSLRISNIENFDFLKLNFTEFFGDNSRQWAWHNVPTDKRAELFPEYPVKLDSNTNFPFTSFNNIKSFKGIPYANGAVYYCNWPQIVSKKGNKKMFLDTKWKSPFEQTWMSHFYQLTLKNKLKPGILLITPTEHHRFDFYEGKDRREN